MTQQATAESSPVVVRRVRRGRRIGQRIVRATVVAVLAMMGLYVTLPWWLPSSVLRTHLAAELSETTGLDVHIGEVALGWGRGLVMRDVTLNPPAGFADTPMIHARQVTTDFSPIDLLDGEIEWMEIDGLTVTVEADSHGRLNVASLQDCESDMQCRRVSIRNAGMVVHVDPAAEPLRVDVHDMQMLREHDGRLSALSIIARVRQRNGDAPLSLQLIEQPGDADQAAEVRGHFRNLDLSQLPVAGNTGARPQLAGRCQGQVSFALTTRGRVDGFELALQASGLAIRPPGATQASVLEDAGLEISADYDAFSERIDIHTASVHLPGLDIQGQASLYADMLAGNLEALEHATLSGSIQPGALRTLLGRQASPGDPMDIEGPVHVEFSARRDTLADRLSLDLELGANAACVKHHGQEIKPAGLPTSLRLAADVNNRTRTLDLKLLSLMLGENVITAEAGSLSDAMDVLDRLAAKGDALSGADVLDALQHASLRGTLRLCDATILAPLFEVSPESLATSGEFRGTWSLKRGDPGWLRVGLENPAAEDFAIGTFLHKPRNQTIRLEMTAALHARDASVRDVQIRLAAGEGLLALRDGRLNFGLGPEKLASTFNARIDAEHVDAFLAMLPEPTRRGVRAEGGASGTIRTRADGETHSAAMQLDASNLALVAGQAFAKPAGQPLALKLATQQAGDVDTLTLGADMTGLSAAVHLPDADGETKASLLATDLNALAGHCPSLKTVLGKATLDGTLDVRLRRRADAGLWELNVQGRQLGCLSSNRNPDVAIDNVRLDVQARIQPAKASTDGLAIDVDRFDLAGPGLEIRQQDGQLRLRRHGSQTLPNDWLAGVDAAAMTFTLKGEPAKILAVFSAARPAENAFAFDGLAEATCRVEIDNEGVIGELNLDAQGLGVTSPDLKKPADMPAHLSLLASRRRAGLSPLVVEQIRAEVGTVSLTGNARLPVTRGTGGAKLQADLRVPDAGELMTLLPRLGQDRWRDLDGRLSARFVWQAPDATSASITLADGVVESLAIQAEDVTAVLRDVPVALDGRLVLGGIEAASDPGGVSQIRTLQTSDLAFRVGQSRGWLVADATDLLTQPGGQVHVLFETLDDRELTAWLGGSRSVPEDELTAERKAQLERQASETIEQMRALFARSDIDVRMTARHYRTYDPVVEQSYDIQNLYLEASAHEGQLSLLYDAGLNGGTIHQSMETRLTQDVPWVRRVTRYREVDSTEAIRPQIAMTFPGNSVMGWFSRDEDVQLTLQHMLANAIDPRYRPVLVGEAKLVATEGVVVGRAAPQFVTRIFPGLNLTEYSYDRMTGFTRFLPDGSQENETLFTGMYDVYMEGTTDADNHASYTLGLVLVPGGVSHEWHREWRQGRFPILKIKGTIDAGKLVDDEVSYPWPNETLFEVFLQNNIVYRAWVNVKSDKASPETSPQR